MARYIDEKDVYKLVEPMGTARVHCSQIDDLPRADVVPKSEVERLEGELIVERTRRENAVDAYREARQKIAREIFEEIEEVLRLHTEGGYYVNLTWFPEQLDVDTKEAIAELKKKYTGSM
ncbi:MAG: hypothetical protein J6S71_02735 [Clostridia bacterium]|nr:hypothetical protein [Clostridia bacterium]